MTVCILLLCAWAVTASAERTSLLVLDLGIVDTTLGEASYTPHDPDDADRLKMAAAVLREALAEHPSYQLVDHAQLDVAVQEATGGWRQMHRCDTCRAAVAETLGADHILTGHVRKISNLILVMNVELHDVSSGERIAAGQVHMRGNTDASWRRAALALLKRELGLIDKHSAPPLGKH
ncbi:MAG: DUF3280 domain-containing protein [Ectothiorhodospiraceae bacterium]|nr:DUF3280 domain-containing protein [Ectothiorhodospiraceae bacterium]